MDRSRTGVGARFELRSQPDSDWGGTDPINLGRRRIMIAALISISRSVLQIFLTALPHILLFSQLRIRASALDIGASASVSGTHEAGQPDHRRPKGVGRRQSSGPELLRRNAGPECVIRTKIRSHRCPWEAARGWGGNGGFRAVDMMRRGA